MFSDEILQLSIESSRLIIRTRRTVGYLLKWTERRCSTSRKCLFYSGKDSSSDWTLSTEGLCAVQDGGCGWKSLEGLESAVKIACQVRSFSF